MEEAAVGSIAHMLKTAFKDVYEDYKKRDDISAKEREIIEIETRIKLVEEEKSLPPTSTVPSNASTVSQSTFTPGDNICL